MSVSAHALDNGALLFGDLLTVADYGVFGTDSPKTIQRVQCISRAPLAYGAGYSDTSTFSSASFY